MYSREGRGDVVAQDIAFAGMSAEPDTEVVAERMKGARRDWHHALRVALAAHDDAALHEALGGERVQKH